MLAERRTINMLRSRGAARWAMNELNMMNVAVTRAKREFYIIGDKNMYLGLGCDAVTNTERIIRQYKKQFPYLVDDQVHKTELPVQVAEMHTLMNEADFRRIKGTVKYVGKGTKNFSKWV